MIARQKWGKSWRLRKRPDTPPLIVTDKQKNAIRIVGHEENAADLGLFVGQSLADARALYPAILAHELNPQKHTALLHHIAMWCGRYTPLVAIEGHDGLFMDITGCSHLLGGETELSVDLQKRLQAQGLNCRLCIADTPGAAWAMAHYGAHEKIAKGAQEDALFKLPVAALRLPEKLVTELSRVGLKTIGAIAELPRAPLTARFGPHVFQRIDQAFGREDEPISPLLPVPELAAEKRFFEPIVYEDDIKATIGLLATNIVTLMTVRGLGARRFVLRLFRVDGEVLFLEANAANPLRDAAQIETLFNERLTALHSDLDAGFGFDIVQLNIIATEPYTHSQNDLLEKRAGHESYDALIDKLGARLGNERVQKYVYADSHIPERSFHLAPIGQSTVMKRKTIAPEPVVQQVLTRPLIILETPELIEAIAEVPDNPPLRFKWRKAFYEIIKAEGPERIAGEWWQDGRGAHTRDYFRLEDTQGHRFWLFRLGLYERETNTPRWFMHGLFA